MSERQAFQDQVATRTTRSEDCRRQGYAGTRWPGTAILRLANEPLVRRIAKGWTALAILLAGGTAGYILIQGWSILDALLMTVTTLSTVGYGEVQPLSPVGKMYSVFLIFFGVGVALYTFNATMQTIFEGQFRDIKEVRKMRSQIDSLRDHFIVCGFGRVGYEVALELQTQGVPSVLIDNDPEVQERARGLGYLYVAENATAAEALDAAGIKRAGCLIAVVGSEAENTYITLCGRALNPGIFIVARAHSALGEDRLREAGADEILSPYRIAGQSIASAALQPGPSDIMDLASGDLRIADMEIGEGSDLVGMTFGEFCRERADGIVVMGLYGPKGRFVLQPSLDRRLNVGDRMVVLSEQNDCASLKPLSDHHPDPTPYTVPYSASV